MNYLGDFAEDATVYIPFNTFTSDDPSASATITNLADADIKVHKDGSTTEIVTDGATVAIDFDSITGNHLITIDTSADAAYAVGSDYLVRIEGTTVDGATVNAWVGHFSIENRTTFPKADFPTNFASLGIESDGDLTKVNTLDGHTAQTGDSFARLGAPDGPSVSADIATVDSNVDTLLTRITSTLFSGITSLAEWLGLMAGKQSGDATALSEIRATGAGSGAFDPTTDSTEALRDHIGDGSNLTEAGGDGDHLTEAGGTGDHLTAQPWNAAWDAEVQSEVTDALNAYDPPTNAEMEARTLVAANYATAADLATVDTVVDNLNLGIIYGAAATGTLSTTQATTDLTGYADDQLIGRVIIWTSGNAEGEATDITDSANTGGLLTFTALTTAPADSDTFKIV